ncbi:unnamed protein product [Microthlaspi erraticum]|uniref:Reverse transcriptase domain-containing protein n=1 Tax=Microthlaspi erraticum TaxID=1685480 RepID=A0A6D2IE83_9BRAS|nr:unnamed protein product [Microthlaspi erraticum]
MERLCHLIEIAIAEKKWRPIKLSQGGPQLSHVCFTDDLILFVEASVAQVRVIRRILEQFCVASGQKVNLEKSKIYFSENVSRDMGKLISEESGIGATRDLGKYLGMHVLQKRINKDTFGEVLEKVSSRLAGWKGHMLSFVGRITLTRSVSSLISVHTMSTMVLPQSTVARLDKTSRSFVWGDTTERRKQHLLSWNKVCRPKGEGGLGIRKSHEMNKALIAKLSWRLLKDETSLWAKVLRSKYRVKDIRDASWWKTAGNWSSTWRSVLKGMREVVIPGLSWVIGDGKSISFWTDRWLLPTTLLEVAVDEIPSRLVEVKPRDIWQSGSGWRQNEIDPYISEETRLQLMSVVLDEYTGGIDRVSWGHTLDGEFSVKSAYTFLTRDITPGPSMNALFTRVWQVIASERTRVFLWLVARQVIMTNMERQRRHLSDTGICQVCKGGEETILHVLRDCPAMSGIWNRIVPAAKKREFFTTPLLGWLDRVKFVRDLAKAAADAHTKARVRTPVEARVERQISWTPPMRGWFKVNTDGASRGNPGRATAGGVLRDEDGAWCCGFALNIGICSAPLAELWGIYYGLYMAWEMRRWRWIRREANRVADGLGNHTFSLPFGFSSFPSPPSEVLPLVNEDVNGSTRARFVRT